MTSQAKSKNNNDEETKFSDIDIIRTDGNRILLPDGMEIAEAILWLKRKQKDEETLISIHEEIRAFPLDGAVAFAQVLKRDYGWTSLRATPGFFGDTPPAMISVDIGYKSVMQVPWGRCALPGIEGFINTSFIVKDGMPMFLLAGEVKRKSEKNMHLLANKVREYVETNSIYRGKAFEMNYRDSAGNRIEEFQPNFAPKFMPPSMLAEEDLIFNQTTMELIKTNVFNPIDYTDRCRQRGIPLKRGILLEGPYGTGKTLTASVTAKKCEENGWTFIYLKDVKDLDLCLSLAKLYQPAVVFAEDVDRAVDTERDTETDQILNKLDGVDTKNHEIIVVLTTNEITAINQAFLRPGRMDAVITVSLPDVDTTVRLVRKYGNTQIKETVTNEELAEAIKPIVGSNAAFVRETVERSKLAAITRDDDRLIAEDIAITAKGMANHVLLLADKTPDNLCPHKAQAEAVAELTVQRWQASMNSEEVQHALRNGAVKGVKDVVNGRR